MYTFLNEGEFVQINLQGDEVTGYISRMGLLDSDRGEYLDQFFDKASIQDHDVTFTTKMVHGVWYEFKGRFDRGRGKTKDDDNFYVLRGALTEYTLGPDHAPASHSRQVEFRWMAQPEDVDPKKTEKKK